MSFGWRTALSAAVVVLAIAMAGLGFMTTGGSGPDTPPRTANASKTVAYIDKQLTEVEQQQARGETGSSSMLAEIVNLTTNLSTQIDTGTSSADVIQKLPDLIERQKKAVDIAVASGDAPELAQADQQLAVAQVKVAAAAQNTATPAATSTVAAALVQPTVTGTPAPTTTPAVTTTPAASPTTTTPQDPATVTGDQIFIGPALGFNKDGILWTALHTSTIRVNVPSSWSLDPFQINKDGLAVLTTSTIVVRHTTDGHEVVVLIAVADGEVFAQIDGQTAQLRGEGADGATIDAAKLASIFGVDAPLLRDLVDSVELLSTPTPAPTTATATETPSPAPTATETPSPAPTQPPAATPTHTP